MGWASPFARVGLRSRDDEVGQSKVAQRPQLHEECVEETVHQRRPDRPEHFRKCPKRLESRKPQEIVEVLHGQPVSMKHRAGKAQLLGQGQRKLPQPAVGIEDDTGRGLAERSYALQDRLQIPEIVHEVRQDHRIEFTFKLQRVRVLLEEFEARMALAGEANHLAGEIHTHSVGRFERGKQVAGPAPDLQDPLAGGDHVPIHLRETPVVVAGRGALRGPREGVPVREAFPAVGVTVEVDPRRRGKGSVPLVESVRAHGHATLVHSR